MKLEFLPLTGAEIMIRAPRTATEGRSLMTTPLEIPRLNDSLRRSLSGGGKRLIHTPRFVVRVLLT